MSLRVGKTTCSFKPMRLQMHRLSYLPQRSVSTGTMKAIVLTQAKKNEFKLSLEELKIPKPKAGEVLIKVRACGVCHSDLHVMNAEQPFPVPAVMGHEMAGEIVEIGAGSELEVKERLKPGQRCVSSFIMPCGHCYFCVRDKEDICETFIKYNRGKGVLYDGHTRLFRLDGSPVHMYSCSGLAEYSVVPATAVYTLPTSIPYAESSILGCAIFTAYGAIKHAAQLRIGENIAVIGTGGVGGNCLQIAKAFGADKIIAIDINDDKLKKMKALGATHTINASRENVQDIILSLTDGRGVNVAVEALGNPITFRQTVEAVMPGGRAVMIGLAAVGTTGQVDITRLVRREVKIIGSYGGKARSDIPELLTLIAKGVIDITSPITRRYSLKQTDRAYHDLNRNEITGRAIIDLHL